MKKPLSKRRLKHALSRKRDALKNAMPGAIPSVQDNVPRITNETVAANREEVLGKARKYIYPLQHSKHRIVLISTTLFIIGLITFFSYCTVALYKLQSSSTFIYRITQVVPFPVARANDRFVSYESYLFELRHYTHYYSSQVKLDFKSNEGKQQLEAFKKNAMDKVINDAYVKQLADKHKITVTDHEVDEQIAIVRRQNRLGNSDKVFEDVLKDYWGWSVNDFKRSLRQEILAQKVASTLDTGASNRAGIALAELKNGADFAATAKKYSDDPSKDVGGDYGALIDRSNRDLNAKVTEALFKLKPNQFSDIVNTGYTLEIVKNLDVSGDKIHAAHITIKHKDITTYINDLKDQKKATQYIRV